MPLYLATKQDQINPKDEPRTLSHTKMSKILMKSSMKTSPRIKDKAIFSLLAARKTKMTLTRSPYLLHINLHSIAANLHKISTVLQRLQIKTKQALITLA